MFVLAAALHADYSIDQLYELTKIDRWFLNNFKNIVTMQRKLENLKVRKTIALNSVYIFSILYRVVCFEDLASIKLQQV